MDGSFHDDFHQKKNVLALRLQQRRPRQILADQGIMPPLKSPGTYFPELQRLERARNKDYLNHALPARPDRDELVQRHILEDTNAAGSLVANQKDLKKAKLVDDLNDKIAFRPGAIELVERNILPATDDLQEAIKGGHLQYKKISDPLDEDSNDALSPEQIFNQTASPSSLFQVTSPHTFASLTAESSLVFTTTKNDIEPIRSSGGSTLFTSSHPYLSRQSSKGSKVSQSGHLPKISSVRKKKEKPKFKKLKYHQYIPPDQHGKLDEISESMLSEDTAYSRLLHQQQVYLQMQIINNQYSGSMPPNARVGEAQPGSSFGQQAGVPPPAPPLTQTMKVHKTRNPNAPLTQSRMEDMKVSELKEELKQRGEKVTGTKEVLLERLKSYCVSGDRLLSEDGNSNFSMMSETAPSGDGHGNFCRGQNSSGSSGAQTAFPIDPKTVLSHKVARMPAPERHKVVLQRDVITMPTWNHTGESMGTQTSFPANQPVGGGRPTKDHMLEKQRMEIHALKQLVERTQAQLQHQHYYGHNVTEDQVQVLNQDQNQINAGAFQFPAATHAAAIQTNDPSIPIPIHAQQQQTMNQPAYDQSFELLNDAQPSSHASVSSNPVMDDILELISDNADVHPSPVARVLLNDHNSYHGLNDSSSNLAQGSGYGQQQDYNSHKPVRLRRRRRPISANRLSQEYGPNGPDYSGHGPRGPDVAKMLVDSSGDALMDTSSFPPMIHRYSYPILDQPSNDHTRLGARNSVDAGLMYSNFSPMDTGSVGTGSQQDLLHDIRLSTSSLDSNEAMLNPGMSPGATPPRRLPSNMVPLSQRPIPSPRYSNHNLVKSASQELLSSNSPSHPSHPGNPTNSELGWLDLTLGSAVANPPSPGNPFETLSMANQVTQQPYQHSNPVSNRGSQDADLNLFSGDPQGILNYPQNPHHNLDYPLDSLDGIFYPNINT